MLTEKRWDTSYEWKVMLVLSLAFGLVGIDRFILPYLFQPMMADLHLNYQDLGNLVGALAIAWGASAFLTGLLSDHLGRRSILVPSVIIFSLLSAFSGMATGLMSLLLIRIVMGVFEGPVASTGVAVAIEASHPKRRGMNNGIFQCTVSLFGSGVGPDSGDPAAGDHDLAPCVLDRRPAGSGDRGHSLVRGPRAGGPRRPARLGDHRAWLLLEPVQASQRALGHGDLAVRHDGDFRALGNGPPATSLITSRFPVLRWAS
ncbi:MAG: MFS transporter [Steroidobacteraceae bacterium]